MCSPATQFVIPKRMDLYEPNYHMISPTEPFTGDSDQCKSASTSSETEGKINERVLEDACYEMVVSSKKYYQQANGSSDKVLRRLAQNREAARKSRLRKKAYIQQLESSRLKLTQLEQQLGSTRKQDVLTGSSSGDPNLALSAVINSGIAAFEIEYAHWVEEQKRQIFELRAALQQNVSDIELQLLVENGMTHYDKLFHMKSVAAKFDVFYLMSGIWRTAAERCFLWMGGFRPSDVLKVLSPQLDSMTDEQFMAVCSLQKSSQQAEDALSQGLERLQQTLSETLSSDLYCSSGAVNYIAQMTVAMGKLDALVSFVNQADHLRQQALRQMYRILLTRQAARGLVALGDYTQRLRALSSLWAARPREPA